MVNLRMLNYKLYISSQRRRQHLCLWVSWCFIQVFYSPLYPVCCGHSFLGETIFVFFGHSRVFSTFLNECVLLLMLRLTFLILRPWINCTREASHSCCRSYMAPTVKSAWVNWYRDTKCWCFVKLKYCGNALYFTGLI